MKHDNAFEITKFVGPHRCTNLKVSKDIPAKCQKYSCPFYKICLGRIEGENDAFENRDCG